MISIQFLVFFFFRGWFERCNNNRILRRVSATANKALSHNLLSFLERRYDCSARLLYPDYSFLCGMSPTSIDCPRVVGCLMPKSFTKTLFTHSHLGFF